MPPILSQSLAYQRGIALFNARQFYDAHEVWEDVWRESQGLEKKFLQGLIQAAVALHHHSTGNVVGARSLMERSCRNLTACPEEYGGIHNGNLLAEFGAFRAALVAAESVPSYPIIVLIK
jgi:predicted metal-dependent hydrolase